MLKHHRKVIIDFYLSITILLYCFADILNRFDLRSKYSGDSFQGSAWQTGSRERNLGDDDNVLKTALANDPKLAKLWKKAEQAGFSGNYPPVDWHAIYCS